MSSTASEPESNLTVSPKARLRRRLAVGCIVPALLLCAALGSVGFAVSGGPVAFTIPGGAAVKLGHDDFVLSNYSFQNGTTYYFDVAGADVREILELHVLSDTHRIELVLNHATKQEQKENHLVDLPVP